ncbi:hypothetical protein [Arthrobacter sp. MA-N2]|uniref:hypothetical protein n=1 Tax=Arthrobacter sp. MA-N2 TaxID=1101188 RepID=UPI0004B58210|nr:hypothetical protein [Arthrobacter sp. MA-N2]
MKPLELVRVGYGMCELLAPDFLTGRLLGSTRDRRATTVIRILGARHLIQAVLTARSGAAAHRIGGSVDVAHAVSMGLLAAMDGRYRTPATANAVLALVFAAGEFE